MSVEERTRATLLAAAETIHPNAGAMLADVEATVQRQAIVRRTVLGIGALVIAVLAGVLGSGVLEGRPSGAEFDPAGGAEHAEVFSFAEHDLCTWFEPIEVAGFLGSHYEWTSGSAELVDLPDGEGDGCLWRLTSAAGADPYEVHAWNAESGTMLPARIVAYEGGTVPRPGGTVIGHPALSRGVVVQSEGWGLYVFWVPPADQYLALALTQLTSEGEVGVDSPGGLGPQARFFAFADQFVQRLGWVPTGAQEKPEQTFDRLP